MTNEKLALVKFMIDEISTMKYCYKTIVEGCYESAINNRGFIVPDEGKESVIKDVSESLMYLGFDLIDG